MEIDYSKIVVTDMKLLISDDELSSIKEDARRESALIKRHGITEFVVEHFFGKAEEVAYGGHRYRNLSATGKALLAANIVLDDEKIANILRSGGFKYETLKTYIKILNYIKLFKNAGKEDQIDTKYVDFVEKFTLKLEKHFRRYIGNNTPHIIINKINEIISFRPELLEKKENTHKR